MFIWFDKCDDVKSEIISGFVRTTGAKTDFRVRFKLVQTRHPGTQNHINWHCFHRWISIFRSCSLCETFSPSVNRAHPHEGFRRDVSGVFAPNAWLQECLFPRHLGRTISSIDEPTGNRFCIARAWRCWGSKSPAQKILLEINDLSSTSKSRKIRDFELIFNWGWALVASRDLILHYVGL